MARRGRRNKRTRRPSPPTARGAALAVVASAPGAAAAGAEPRRAAEPKGLQMQQYAGPRQMGQRAVTPPGVDGATASAVRASTRLEAGRQTMDDPFLWGTTKLPMIVTPESPEDTWRNWRLDAQTLSRFPPERLLLILADISPEVASAIFSALRFCNPGQEIKALRPGTGEQDAAAQAALDEMLTVLDDLYVTRDVVWVRQFLALMIRGGCISETVLDSDARTFVDLAVPDPATLRWRRTTDTIRGQIWQTGQWQGGQFVVFDRPTVAYVPFDPMPGRPYGRPIMGPALFLSIFMLALMHDIRRVVQQQGYARADIIIDTKKLRESMPSMQIATVEEWAAWVDTAVAQVKTMWRNLEPEDAYIHTDMVSVELAKGAISADALGSIDGLIKAIERGITRAVKSVPILMAITEGATEANANRQWESHIAGIKSMQHYIESLNERLLGLGLRARGIQAKVQFRFAELRASEMLYDEQAMTLRLKNAFLMWAQGYETQDAAAQYAVGHAPAKPDPILIPGTETPLDLALNPPTPPPTMQPTDNTTTKDAAAAADRWAKQGWKAYRVAGQTLYLPPDGHENGHVRAADDEEKVKPKGAAAGLPAVPARVDVTEVDRRAVLATWDNTFPEHAGLLDAAVVTT